MKKRVLVYLIGFNIVVLGIALLIASKVGQSAWDGVNVGLSQTLSISVGQATILVSMSLLTISYFLSRQWQVYLSFVTSLIQGILIDVYLNVILNVLKINIPENRIIIFIAGIILMAVGCAIYIQSGLPTNHVDKLMLSISDKYHLSLRSSKWITDLIAIIFTFVLLGRVDYGTYLIIVILGPLMSLIASYIQKPIAKFINQAKVV